MNNNEDLFLPCSSPISIVLENISTSRVRSLWNFHPPTLLKFIQSFMIFGIELIWDYFIYP